MSTIREANSSDLMMIQKLAYKIWPTTYGEILSEEQLKFMLEKFYAIDYLENQMRNGQHFILIEEENSTLGFASYELNYENSNKTKIHKIYVLPEIQGKGLGKKLINFIIKKALENNNSDVLLNVNRFNKAIGFYENIGFKISETVDIEIGNGYLMEDYIMRKTCIVIN